MPGRLWLWHRHALKCTCPLIQEGGAAVKQEMDCWEEKRYCMTGLCLTEQEIKEEVYVMEVCVFVHREYYMGVCMAHYVYERCAVCVLHVCACFSSLSTTILK